MVIIHSCRYIFGILFIMFIITIVIVQNGHTSIYSQNHPEQARTRQSHTSIASYTSILISTRQVSTSTERKGKIGEHNGLCPNRKNSPLATFPRTVELHKDYPVLCNTLPSSTPITSQQSLAICSCTVLVHSNTYPTIACSYCMDLNAYTTCNHSGKVAADGWVTTCFPRDDNVTYVRPHMTQIVPIAAVLILAPHQLY